MNLEWHKDKEQANIKKHGLDFSFADHMGKDPLGVVIYDKFENGEHRYHAIAMAGETLLVLVHTYPDPANEDRIWVIGLRKATPHERKQYEEGGYDG